MKHHPLVSAICLLGLISGLMTPAGAAARPVLVFVTNHETGNFDLRIKYSDGSFSEPLDPPSDSSSAAQIYNSSSTPAVSPDGKKIAFYGWYRTCSSVGCVDTGAAIYTMNIDGSALTPIYRMHDESFEWVLDPRWSPDGTRIVFTVNYKKVDGQRRLPDLWVLEVDARGVWTPSPLSTRPGNEYWAEWSPDGKHIAYTYNPDDDGFAPAEGDHTTIDIVRSDGSGAPRTLVRGYWVTQPAFSPDGRSIAYVDMGESGDENNRIRIMRRDGNDRRTIARGVKWPWSLDYSPDGRFIAFGEGWKNQHERILRVQVAPPHRMSVLVDFENAYDHMPDYFPLP